MVTWNIGSVANTVQNIVENVPATISGLELINMADRERVFAENFTGATIGSTDIAETYQGALVDLTASALLNYMDIVGADVNEVRLSELTIKKGQGSNLQTASQKLKELGMFKLKELGKSVKFSKAFG